MWTPGGPRAYPTTSGSARGRAGAERGKAANRQPTPKGAQIVEEGGQKFVLTPGKPYCNAASRMDLFVNGLGENDKVGTRALAELSAHKDERFFVFIHFQNPDHAGHKSGENSREYTDGIREDDAWTGKIIGRLKELGLYERTLVYVTADHGFNEGARNHSYAPYVFLATNDKQVTRNGIRSDLAPTILKRFGLDPKTITPALDGIPYGEAAPERKAPATPTAEQMKGRQRQGKGRAAPAAAG